MHRERFSRVSQTKYAAETLGDLEKLEISFKIEARKKILPKAYI